MFKRKQSKDKKALKMQAAQKKQQQKQKAQQQKTSAQQQKAQAKQAKQQQTKARKQKITIQYLRSDFFRDGFQRLWMLSILLVGATILCALMIFYLAIHPPKDVYIKAYTQPPGAQHEGSQIPPYSLVKQPPLTNFFTN